MKLVLYSGGQQRSNSLLHRALVKLAREGKPRSHVLTLTYIPYCSDSSETFFKRAMRRYRAYGVERFFCLHVDENPTREEIHTALQSDIIYLSGGNTFYFLKHLRESGMLAKLPEFVKKGGVMAGLSAGGLIMSPTVKLAADEGLGPDENDVKLKNFKGLGFYPFEFSPHFSATKKQVEAHLAYSKTTKNPVYALSDGSGMVIKDKKVQVMGQASLFFDGKLVTSHSSRKRK
jgi:dipeptidase E